MILSASRRTDIPAFYSKWFINRLKEGFVYVRNPVNIHQISLIPLNPNVVDCIVFWTKNPEPLIEKLGIIDDMGYPYYFQFTLTPYNSSIERGIKDKEHIIDIFRRLSRRIGKKKVIWRYDPVIINSNLNINYHINSFNILANKLAGFTEECIISFVDSYKKTVRHMRDELTGEIAVQDMRTLAIEFASIAKCLGLSVKTCAEMIELQEYGIGHASCIDEKKIEDISGYLLKSGIKKDSQRIACQCVECIDIGAYNTCKNGCRYCYATVSETAVMANCRLHDPMSPLLIGNVSLADRITERKVVSFKEGQKRLF